MKKRAFSFTGKAGVLLLLVSVVFIPFSGSMSLAAESAASAASEGAETESAAPSKKPPSPEKPAPYEAAVPAEPGAEAVTAAGEAGPGATKELKGKTNVWYIVLGVAAVAAIAGAAGGGGGGGGGGSTSNH